MLVDHHREAMKREMSVVLGDCFWMKIQRVIVHQGISWSRVRWVTD